MNQVDGIAPVFKIFPALQFSCFFLVLHFFACHRHHNNISETHFLTRTTIVAIKTTTAKHYCCDQPAQPAPANTCLIPKWTFCKQTSWGGNSRIVQTQSEMRDATPKTLQQCRRRNAGPINLKVVTAEPLPMCKRSNRSRLLEDPNAVVSQNYRRKMFR